MPADAEVMTEKELLAEIDQRTQMIRSWFGQYNPYNLPTDGAMQIYQQLDDEVRRLATDIRVALRNYDKVMLDRQATKS